MLSQGVSTYLSLLKNSEENVSGVGGVKPLSLNLENSEGSHAGFGGIHMCRVWLIHYAYP